MSEREEAGPLGAGLFHACVNPEAGMDVSIHSQPAVWSGYARVGM